MKDIQKYIFARSQDIFGKKYGKPIDLSYSYKRYTSIVYFCQVKFQNDLKKIVVKYYDDGHPSRSSSLEQEYYMSKKYTQKVNSNETGAIKCLYLDKKNNILVMDYLQDAVSFESTLFKNQNYFNRKNLDKIFYNIGLWLSFFHKINISEENYEINENFFSVEVKSKWIKRVFNKT